MSVKVYYAVKSAHYNSNRYIYESLSLAENQVAKLKKDYPRDDVKIERLVVGEEYDKLEARCKELQQWFDWQKCSSHFNLLVEATEENRILKAQLEKCKEQRNEKVSILADLHNLECTKFFRELDKELDSITIDSIKRGE